MPWAYTPLSWRGTSLQSGNYRAYFAADNSPIGMEEGRPIEVDTLRGPVDGGMRPAGAWLELEVWLQSWQEGDLGAFWRLFDPDLGPGDLEVRDGDGASWLLTCRPAARPVALGAAPNIFRVPLRASEAVLRAPTTASLQVVATSSPANLTPSVGGNRRTWPVITITPNQAKTAGVNDYKYVIYRGFAVNRTSLPLIDCPVYLSDVSGGQSRFDSAAIVGGGNALASGDDVRVWVDGREVPRWLVGWNTTSTDVVTVLSFPPAPSITLAAAMTASAPANGGSIPLRGELEALPPRGAVVIDNEVVAYNGVDLVARSILAIQRALWGTTAAAHASGVPVYPNPKLFVVGSGKSSSAAPDLPPSPAVDLSASRNQKWQWGGSGAFVRSGASASWATELDNASGVAGRTSASDLGATFTVVDNDPLAPRQPVNAIRIGLPQGISTAANAVQLTLSSPAPQAVLRTELWASDAAGRLDLAGSWQGDAGLQALTPASAWQSLKLLVRYDALTGLYDDVASNWVAITNTVNSPTDNGAVAVRITVRSDFWTDGIRVPLVLAAAGSQGFQATLHSDASDAPGTELLRVSGTVTSTAPQWFTLFNERVLRAGTYWLVIFRNPPINVELRWLAHNGPAHYESRQAKRVGGAWDYTVLPPVHIVRAHWRTPAVQPENPLLRRGARSGLQAAVSSLSAVLDRYPYVHRYAATLYHCAATVSSGTTGESFTLDTWCPVGGSLEIDGRTGAVTLIEGGYRWPLGRLARYSSAQESALSLLPGANSVTYADPELVNTTVRLEWRARRR